MVTTFSTFQVLTSPLKVSAEANILLMSVTLVVSQKRSWLKLAALRNYSMAQLQC
jgi:hypothetical protein